VKVELAVMRLFIEYLRSCAGLQRPSLKDEVSVADALLQRYEDYLRKDRGLTENSVHVYVPFIRDFLLPKPHKRAACPRSRSAR